ncbi:glycosyl hydrolase, partial [Thermomicrobiaceae bacterium CFH 74404]|nr:glycosyl hydrolase [Thermalbibacter longus]
LYQPRPTVRMKVYHGFGSSVSGTVNYRWAGPLVYAAWVEELPTAVTEERPLDAGKNPPDGVIVTYYLRERPEGEVRLTFLDMAGNELRSFSSEKPADPLPELPKEKKPKEEPRLEKEAGFHQFVWDLRVAGARRVVGDKSYEEYLAGPRVVPGAYQVRLTVGEQSWTQAFDVRRDPRIEATEEDLREQFDLLLRIRDKVSEAHDAINQIRSVRQQLGEWRKRIEAQDGRTELIEAAGELEKKLVEIEEELIQPKMDDPRQFPWKLAARLAALTSFVESADSRPTQGEREVYATLAGAIDEQLSRLRELLATELAELNRRLAAAGVPAIVPRTALVPAGG